MNVFSLMERFWCSLYSPALIERIQGQIVALTEGGAGGIVIRLIIWIVILTLGGITMDVMLHDDSMLKRMAVRVYEKITAWIAERRNPSQEV